MAKKKNDTDFTVTLLKEKKPRKKRNQKNYTTQQIQEGLLLLEKNRNNMNKTAKELGVPRSTIQSWAKNHTVEVYQKTGDGKTAEIVTKTRQTAEQAFDELADEVIPTIRMGLIEAIEKARTLIALETDLNKINGAVKVLSESAAKFAGKTEQAQVNNIQQYIQNQQNNYDKELS
jgi:hypothetical protein